MAEFMAVQRQARFKPQSVPGAKTHRPGAFFCQQIPDRAGIFSGDKQLKADRFAGIPGTRKLYLRSVYLDCAEGVSDRIRQSTGRDNR